MSFQQVIGHQNGIPGLSRCAEQLENWPLSCSYCPGGAEWVILARTIAKPPSAGTKKGSQPAALFSSRPLLLEAAAEPIFHPAGERSAGTLAAALTCTSRGARAITSAGESRAGNGKHHAAEHHDETDHGQRREGSDHGGLKRHSGNQHGEAEQEQPRALQPSPRRRGAQPTAANARGEFRVLGIESALDLIEHPLLMIGEWHSSLLADRLGNFDTTLMPVVRATNSDDTSRIRAVPPVRERFYPGGGAAGTRIGTPACRQTGTEADPLVVPLAI